GDKVSKGTPIGKLQTAGTVAPASAPQPPKAPAATPSASVSVPSAAPTTTSPASDSPKSNTSVYAGPAVRKLARQLGVDLAEVKASGPRSRIIKDDVRNFVKAVMENRAKGGGVAATAVGGIPAMP